MCRSLPLLYVVQNGHHEKSPKTVVARNYERFRNRGYIDNRCHRDWQASKAYFNVVESLNAETDVQMGEF